MTLSAIVAENFIEISRNNTVPSRYMPTNFIRNGPKFVFNDMKTPILCLLFDMGIQRSERSKTPAIYIYCSYEKLFLKVWAIHSLSHDKTVFGCVSRMGITSESKMFFATTLQSEGIHDELAYRNRIFYRLHEDVRYAESW